MLSTTHKTTAPTSIDHQTQTCPACDAVIEHGPAEHVCPECDLVIDASPLALDGGHRTIERTQEGHLATQQSFYHDPDRVDGGLGSHMGRWTERQSDRQRRLWKWHKRSRGSKQDRNRGYATDEIRRMVVSLDLPDRLSDRGCHLWRSLHEDPLNGQDMDVLTAGCVLIAAREDGQGIGRQRLAEHARCEPADITRGALLVASRTDGQLPPPNLTAHTRRLAHRCAVSRAVCEAAVERVRATDDAALAGRTPDGVAAGALWLAGSRTQQAFADAAGVSSVTLRQSARALEEEEGDSESEA